MEALLSGPAASVMGMMALMPSCPNTLVLDMGGTTTDIALLPPGSPYCRQTIWWSTGAPRWSARSSPFPSGLEGIRR
ncbi:MAG: hydantoinase/oxoprolinase family protein [Bilophila wadsworthia]